MGNIKTFLDHLYFSLVSVLVGMIGVYIVLYILDGALDVFGMGLGVSKFSVGSHILALSIIWIAVAVPLAGYLTFRSIEERPRDRIVYTKRQQ